MSNLINHGNLVSVWEKNRTKQLNRFKTILKRLSRNRPSAQRLEEVHDAVFEQIDCLQCGNCCKTASPIFNKTDVARIAAAMGIKPSELETTYLVADPEGDLVPKTMPCPFLNGDNTCQVYEVRPKSCRGFPHTNHRDSWERHALLAKNTFTCPAAYHIVERISQMQGR